MCCRARRGWPRACSGCPGALEEGEAPAAAPDASFTVLHGLYWLCANLAADQLVVLSVDDAHWADTSSLALPHLSCCRACEELKIALLVATRPDAEAQEAHLLATLTADPHAEVVQPAPLSAAGRGPAGAGAARHGARSVIHRGMPSRDRRLAVPRPRAHRGPERARA